MNYHGCTAWQSMITTNKIEKVLMNFTCIQIFHWLVGYYLCCLFLCHFITFLVFNPIRCQGLPHQLPWHGQWRVGGFHPGTERLRGVLEVSPLTDIWDLDLNVMSCLFEGQFYKWFVHFIMNLIMPGRCAFICVHAFMCASCLFPMFY